MARAIRETLASERGTTAEVLFEIAVLLKTISYQLERIAEKQ